MEFLLPTIEQEQTTEYFFSFLLVHQWLPGMTRQYHFLLSKWEFLPLLIENLICLFGVIGET